MAPIKLIIDTDPGIDDAMAILAALNATEEVEVLGITTVFGNVPTAVATRNALRLSALAGGSVPVAQGASFALNGALKQHVADFVHGKDGFGNTTIGKEDKEAEETEAPSDGGEREGAPSSSSSSSPLLPIPAAQFIVEQVNRYPGEVSVLALAPATNVALALMLDPALPAKARSLVFLGGAFFRMGNVTPAAEANCWGDPEAADLLFKRWSGMRVLGLDVTHRCVLSRARVDALAGRGRHGTFLRDISQFYLAYHAESYDGMQGVFVHDAAAFVAVVRPELFEWTRGSARVATVAPFRGRTLLDDGSKKWYGPNDWQGIAEIHVATGVDAEQVVDLVERWMQA